MYPTLPYLTVLYGWHYAYTPPLLGVHTYLIRRTAP